MPPLLGAGEGAFFVAVELAFDQLRGNSVQPTLTKGKPWRCELRWMTEAIRSLPTPVSPHKQHVGVGAAQISIIRLTRRMAATGRRSPGRCCGRGRLGAAAGGGPAGCLAALDPGKQRKDVLVAERLGDEVEGPELHRLDGHGNAAVGGHHDHFDVGQRALLDALEQLDAVDVGHLQVGHDDVEPLRFELAQGFGAVGRGDHLVALACQVVGQGDPLDLFVVDDQDSHGCTGRGRLGRPG